VFEPPIENKEDIALQYRNLLSGLPNALMEILVNIPILRPACELERNNHVYVFNEGEEGEAENKIYKYRKECYDSLSALFASILTAAFPDVEYINACALYQQEYVADHSQEDVDAYKEEIKEVTEYVRSHMDEILKEVTGDEEC
jgi:hypothetical protein